MTQPAVGHARREQTLDNETLDITPIESFHSPVRNVKASPTLRPVVPSNDTAELGTGRGNSDADEEAMNLREGRYDHFMTSLDQFLQSTTFHGIRYIFQKSEFRNRRYALVQPMLQQGREKLLCGFISNVRGMQLVVLG